MAASLVRLPATHSAERVAIWRKLKKSGAIQIQTSTYILPDDPPRYERFQWLTQHIRDAGGDATLVRVREIEGLSNERLIELFNAARAKEYASLREMLRPFVATRSEDQIWAANLIAFENNFARSERPIFLTAPKRKISRWFCGNWRKLSPSRKRNPSSSREIFAAESGSLGRGRRSIASARHGSFANSSIRKQNSFLDTNVLRTGACSRSTCWTAISRMMETIARSKR